MYFFMDASFEKVYTINFIQGKNAGLIPTTDFSYSKSRSISTKKRNHDLTGLWPKQVDFCKRFFRSQFKVLWWSQTLLFAFLIRLGFDRVNFIGLSRICFVRYIYAYPNDERAHDDHGDNKSAWHVLTLHLSKFFLPYYDWIFRGWVLSLQYS